MKQWKRRICVLMAAVIVLSGIYLPAAAEENQEELAPAVTETVELTEESSESPVISEQPSGEQEGSAPVEKVPQPEETAPTEPETQADEADPEVEIATEEAALEQAALDKADLAEKADEAELPQEELILEDGQPLEEDSLALEAALTISDTDVVAIGNQGYPTLQAAVAAAQSGSTITVVKDFTLSSVVTVNKNLTLLGGGHTITVSPNSYLDLTGGMLVLGSGDSSDTLTLDGNNVYSNRAMVQVNGGTLHIRDGVTIRNGVAPGGGVWVQSGTAFMSGGTVTQNRSVVSGGGIYVNTGGKLILSGGEVRGNRATGGHGGGIACYGTVEMTGGTVADNIDEVGSGGGVYINNGKFTLSGGKITGGSALTGGGVYLNEGTFMMTGGTISGNTAIRGGGVYVEGNDSAPGTFTMSGGSITGNTASNPWAASPEGGGGGVYVDRNGSFILTDGKVSSNHADDNDGGGIYDRGAVEIIGGAVSDNTAYRGGGLTVRGKFAMTGGAISGNQSVIEGGGMYFTGSGSMSAGEVVENHTVGSGGGISFYYGSFTMTNGVICNNTAGREAADLFLSPFITVVVNAAGMDRTFQDTGIKIDGWYLDGQSNRWSAESPTDVVDENTVGGKRIIAAYTPTYTVTFDSNGGSDVDDQTGLHKNATATEPSDPTREGYTFQGWYLDGSEYDFSAPVTGDITLVAQWKINTYTVTFDSDGGGDVDPQTVDYNDAAAKPVDPTREGHTFQGWYLDGSEYDFSTPVTEDITLVAQWKINTYTVTFDSDGGSDVDAQTVDYNATATEPSDPTREGYTFQGWYLDGAEYDFSTPVTENITLIAKWEKDESGKKNDPGKKDDQHTDEKKETKNDTPKTGDHSIIGVWILTFAASAVCGVIALSHSARLVAVKRSKRQK